MSDPGGVSPGEMGGMFAGAVALLGTIGAGIRWLLGWKERRAESRSAKLQAWHDELVAREARLDAERERDIAGLREDIAKLRREHGALLNAYQLLAGALRVLDATNPALRMADEMLRAAYPVDAVTPADMRVMLGSMDAVPGQP